MFALREAPDSCSVMPAPAVVGTGLAVRVMTALSTWKSVCAEGGDRGVGKWDHHLLPRLDCPSVKVT